jgi:hypothetical protein
MNQHFAYLLDGSGPQTKVASERLELLANLAAKRYLEERTPLNNTIKKLAAENDLNHHQIQRVCEMANIATHQGLWQKTAEKDKVAFPLADAKTVVQVVKKVPSDSSPVEVTPPCGDMDSDYHGPPRGLPTGPPLSSLMNADPAAGHDGLLGPTPERKQIIIILQKRAGERQKLASEIIYKGMELETLEKQAYHEVKQAVMGGESFRNLLVAATSAGLSKVAAQYLPSFFSRLRTETTGRVRLQLEKEAIARAPSELISDELGNIAVVNGAHPVLVSLDTLQRKTGEVRNGIQDLLRIDDEIKLYTQRLRDLS